MKKLLFLAISLLSFVNCPTSLNAQTIPPPFINYQAVLYDVNGANPNNPLTNQSFSTFVNINDELGNLLYREEHYASTDANGLITVKMGDGVYTSGSLTNFNQINWGIGKYYLVVDFDINGTISSTAPDQLVTVPYTFYAGNAGNGMAAVADNGNGTLTFTYANGQTYITPTLSGIQGAVGPAGPPGTSGSAGPQGASGPQGQAGVNGTNGLNALIKTTTEPVGANCTNGGTKIETGLDINLNGILDAGEVNSSQTKYICNGNGIVGGNVQFANMADFATPGTYIWLCPSNVTKVMVEIWGGGGAGSGYGGQGGGYGKQIIDVNPGSSYTIIVGAGGVYVQSSSSSLTIGGNSSCFGLISYGGNDGSPYGYNNTGTSSALISITGQGGTYSPCSNQSEHGNGGASGNGGFNIGPCGNGNFPGGGGGAYCNCGGVTGQLYSGGANGRVLIWY
jgi:hypothetical protein